VADHVHVDLTLLQDTAAALGVLRTEFSQAGAIVDANSQAVGAQPLVSALNTFAGNWKRHRQSLVTSIDAAEKMAQTGHDSYVKLDDAQARALVAAEQGPASGTGGR
jgi:hypothetical protein